MTPSTMVCSMGLRVLVVEDDVVNRRFIGEWLISNDHQCVLTGSLAEATQALDERQFDLCLADINLSDGDGRALSSRAGEHTRLLFMSGDPPETNSSWLHKPLSVQILHQALQGVSAQASLLDPLPPERLPDLDDLAAGTALGAGLVVLGGLRQLLRRELQRDQQRLLQPWTEDELGAIIDLLHRLKASSALCGLPRLHSATHQLWTALTNGSAHLTSLEQWHEAASRALTVIAQPAE